MIGDTQCILCSMWNWPKHQKVLGERTMNQMTIFIRGAKNNRFFDASQFSLEKKVYFIFQNGG